MRFCVYRVECSVNELRSALTAFRIPRCVMRLHAFRVSRFALNAVCMYGAGRFIRLAIFALGDAFSPLSRFALNAV